MKYGKKGFGVKNLMALMLTFCMIVQSAFADGNLIAALADVVEKGSAYTEGPTEGEPVMGQGPVGDTDYIALASVELYDKDGEKLSPSTEGESISGDGTQSIFVRYNLMVDDKDTLIDKSIKFYIPEAIGIFEDVNFKLEEDGERFAQVNISRTNLVTITLLKPAEHMIDITAYIQIETFWKGAGAVEGGPHELKFPLGSSGDNVFKFDLTPIDVTADVNVKKTGTYNDNTGMITWKIVVEPFTKITTTGKPIVVPVNEIVVTDIIPNNQMLAEKSTFKVYPSPDTEEAIYRPQMSYGLRAEKAWEATPSNTMRAETKIEDMDLTDEDLDIDFASPSNTAQGVVSAKASPSSPNKAMTFSLEREAAVTYAEPDVLDGLTWDDSKNQWEFKFAKVFPGGITGKYTIEFQTKPTADSLLASNCAWDSTLKSYALTYQNNATVTYPLNAKGGMTGEDSSEPVPTETKPVSGIVQHPVNYIIKGGDLNPGHDSIDWKVTINSTKLALHGAKITDTLPKGLKLDTDNVYFGRSNSDRVKLVSCPESKSDCEDTDHFYYVVNEDKITTLSYYVGGTVGEPYKETGTFFYTTKITDDWYLDTREGFVNRAKLTITNLGTGGPGEEIPDVVTSVDRTHKWIIKEPVGKYNEQTGELTWRVTLNGEGLLLTDVVFGDLMGDRNNDQVYVSGSLKGGSGETLDVLDDTKWVDEDGDLKHEFKSLNAPYYIEFKTTILTDDSSGNQPNKKYINTATIKGMYNTHDVTQSATAPQLITSSTLEKEALGYNYNTREITWKLTVNKNAMVLKDAKVVDTLPEYWKLVANSMKVLKPLGGNVTLTETESGTIEFSLPSEIDETYEIEYKTILTEEGIEPTFGLKKDSANNGKIEIPNTAKLTSTDGKEVSVTVNQPIENSIVKKIPIYESGDDFIKWRVVINQNKTEILPEGAHLSIDDDLNRIAEDGYELDLDMHSVKVYQDVKLVNDKGEYLGVDGKIDCQTIYSVDGDEIHKLTGGTTENNIYYNNKKFMFDFSKDNLGAKVTRENINEQTFILEFCTNIIVDGNKFGGAIKNSVNASGLTQGVKDEGIVGAVNFTKGSGGATGRKGILSIEKVDKFNHSIKLAGAEFQMLHGDFNDMVFYDVIEAGEDGALKVEHVSFNRNYILKETKTPDGYVKPSSNKNWPVKIAKGVPNDTFTLLVENIPKLGWMPLQKVSSATENLPVAGAEIGVWDASIAPDKATEANVANVVTNLTITGGGEKKAIYTSDNSGGIVVAGLRCGDYYFKELKAPEGYLLNEEPVYFTIDDIDAKLDPEDVDTWLAGNRGYIDIGDKDKVPELTNTPYGKVTIDKVDKFTTTTKLQGAKFGLYTDEMHKTLVSSTSENPQLTNAEGQVIFDGLEVGTYYWKEIESPANYIKSESDTGSVILSVDVADNVTQNIVVTVVNEPVGKVMLTKVDAWNSDTKIDTATFKLTQILAANGVSAYVEITKTTQNGTVTFDNLPFGTYKWEETASPEGYIMRGENNTTGTFTVDADNFATVQEPFNITNEPIKGSFTIKKTEPNGTISLAGATLGIYTNSACTIEYIYEKNHVTAVTDANGVALFTNLRYRTGGDKYYCKEIIAPPTGYALSNQVIEFQIKDDGITVNADFTHGPIIDYPIGGAKITKVDSRQSEDSLLTITSGTATFEVWADKETDQYHDNKCERTDCPVYIAKGNTPVYHYHGTGLTTTKGVLNLTGLKIVGDGKYSYKETVPPSGYLLDTTVRTFTVTHNITTEITVQNEPIGSIKITKEEMDSNRTLQGAEFKLFKDQECTIAVNNTIFASSATDKSVERTTDSNGIISFSDISLKQLKDLYNSTIYVKEIKAPVGYQASGEVWKVEVGTQPGDTKEQVKTFKNAPTLASFKLIKVYDSQTENGKVAVQGATFTLYKRNANNTVGDVVDTADSIEDGTVTFTNIQTGNYAIKETEAPTSKHWLLNNDDEIWFDVTDAQHGKTLTTTQLSNAGTTTELHENAVPISIINIPVGNFKLTKSGDGETPLKDVEITLTKKDNTSFIQKKSTNESGIVTFENLEFGEYTWQETGRAPGYFLDKTDKYKGNFTINGKNFQNDEEEVRNVLLTNESIKAAIQVQKVKAHDGEPLSGAVMDLYQQDGDSWNKFGESVTTGIDGYAKFTNLPIGEYYCKEILAPDGYQMTDTKYYFSIEDKIGIHDTTIIEDKNSQDPIFANTLIGSFELTKVDSTDERKVLEGAKIKLTKTDTVPYVIFEKVTGLDGIVKFVDIPYGNYTWEETESPAGYIMGAVKSGSFTLNQPGQEEKFTLPNRPLPNYTLKIAKTGEPGNRPLAGAVIGIYHESNDTLIESVTTDQNGLAVFTAKLLCETADNYYYKEITAPKGYVKDDTKYPFHYEDNKVDLNVVYERTLANTLQRGSFQFNKVDGSETPNPVSGVTFELTYKGPGESGTQNPLEAKDLVRQVVSDSDGKVRFDNLPLGEYECREIAAPDQYHLEKDWIYPVELTADKPNATLKNEQGIETTFINFGLYIGDLEIVKKDADGDYPLAGSVIGVYAASNHDEIAKVETKADGKAVFLNLYEGDYYYKELKAPKGYALDTEEYPFTINTNGQKLVRELINHKLIQGSFRLTKTGHNDVPLAGAVIGLYIAEDNRLMEQKTTDSQGIVQFDGLEKDEQQHYYYKELKAPEGYQLDDAKYPFDFTITTEGQVMTGTLVNSIKTGSFQLVKVRKGTETLLKGADIAIYQKDGTLLQEKTTGEDGKVIFTDLIYGEYYWEETKAPSGYVKDKEQYPFTISDHGQVVEVILENTPSPSSGGGGGKPPVNPGIVDPNAPGPGKPPVTPEVPIEPGVPGNPGGGQETPLPPIIPAGKEPDGSTDIVIPNVPPKTDVTIKNPNSNDEVYRGTTDDDGKVNVKLPPGQYVLTVIDENGVPLAQYTFTIEDDEIPLAGLPKTGERMPISLWMGSMMLIVLLGTYRVVYRKKREE